MFCVDSSVDMNNLALALLRGGNKTESGVENEAVPGLFFRQFLPTSSTVRLNSFNYHTIIYYVDISGEIRSSGLRAYSAGITVS
jgi:hypothetical protein